MTSTERQAYEQKMDARLAKWDAQMQALKARAREAGADVKAEIGEELHALEERSKAAKKKLRAFREASGDAWQDLKEGLDESWQALDRSLQEARKRYH